MAVLETRKAPIIKPLTWCCVCWGSGKVVPSWVETNDLHEGGVWGGSTSKPLGTLFPVRVWTPVSLRATFAIPGLALKCLGPL